MKKAASKVAEPAQIQPKSQFLFHKNLPPRDFSIMTLDLTPDLAPSKYLPQNFRAVTYGCMHINVKTEDIDPEFKSPI